jgi:putative proteasome-type protease
VILAADRDDRNSSVTYCVGILVQDGLVMIADTRTNAGLDDISTFRKLHVFNWPGDRSFGLMTAGNLSITQSVVSLLQEGLPNAETGELDTLQGASSMFRAAQFVGRCIRHVREFDGPALKEAGVKFEVSMLFGGQIKGQPMRLFMVYGAGNFIECGADAPFLQIGEHKYGKPILDRAITFKSHLYDALKVGLISMDSTMRSNLGVGLPIDMLVMRRDGNDLELNRRIEAGEPYFHDLRERWSAALRAAHTAIPRPPYGPPPA